MVIPIFGTCAVLGLAFLMAFVLAIVGNVLGAWAWRYRVDDLSAWSPLLSQWYLLNSENFESEGHPIRLAALVTLILGAALGVAVVISGVIVLDSGATNVCGFYF